MLITVMVTHGIFVRWDSSKCFLQSIHRLNCYLCLEASMMTSCLMSCCCKLVSQAGLAQQEMSTKQHTSSCNSDVQLIKHTNQGNIYFFKSNVVWILSVKNIGIIGFFGKYRTKYRTKQKYRNYRNYRTSGHPELGYDSYMREMT